MGKQNQAITTYTNWKIVINAAEDMKVVSKCLWRVANCRYIAGIQIELVMADPIHWNSKAKLMLRIPISC